MKNPEDAVIDAIDELVDWQLEQGELRGEYPPDDPADWLGLSAAFAPMQTLHTLLQEMAQAIASAFDQEVMHVLFHGPDDDADGEDWDAICRGGPAAVTPATPITPTLPEHVLSTAWALPHTGDPDA